MNEWIPDLLEIIFIDRLSLFRVLNLSLRNPPPRGSRYWQRTASYRRK